MAQEKTAAKTKTDNRKRELARQELVTKQLLGKIRDDPICPACGVMGLTADLVAEAPGGWATAFLGVCDECGETVAIVTAPVAAVVVGDKR